MYCIEEEKCYMFRSVTMYYTGKVAEIHRRGDGEAFRYVLKNASWISDTGRWADYLKNPKKIANEIEPYPKDRPVFVWTNGLLDACEIDENFLPVEQK